MRQNATIVLIVQKVAFIRYVDNITILPGETFILSDSTSTYTSYYWRPTNIPDPHHIFEDFQICLLAPDHRFDQDISNDCEIAAVSYIASSKEPIWNSAFHIFPNPTLDVINLSINFQTTPKEVTIEIFDLLGKRYYKEQLSPSAKTLNHLLHCDNMPSGVYFIQVNADKEVATRKVIVNE